MGMQSIGKIKSSIESNSKVLFLSSTSRCKKQTSRKYKKSNDMFILAHHQNFKKTISTKNSNHQQTNISPTSSPQSHASGGFPRKSSSEEMTIVVLLHIHGRLGLQELLNHGVVAGLGCEVQRCFASGAAARGQAAGSGTEGDKIPRLKISMS